MQAKLFLLVNAVIVGILILRLFSGRRQPRPTPLSFDKASVSDPRAPLNVEGDPGPQSERILNCYFQFNGMMMDAFEILGVPAGAPKDQCYRAYVDLRRRTGAKSSPELLDVAWAAIDKRIP